MTLDTQRKLVARKAQLLSELKGLPAQRKEAKDSTAGDAVERAVSFSQLAEQEALIKRELELIDPQLAAARIISSEGCGSSEVALGSKVTVRLLTGKKRGQEATYLITGNGGPSEGEIRSSSPLATALMGHTAGQTVEFKGGDKEAHQVLVVEIR